MNLLRSDLLVKAKKSSDGSWDCQPMAWVSSTFRSEALLQGSFEGLTAKTSQELPNREERSFISFYLSYKNSYLKYLLCLLFISIFIFLFLFSFEKLLLSPFWRWRPGRSWHLACATALWAPSGPRLPRPRVFLYKLDIGINCICIYVW